MSMKKKHAVQVQMGANVRPSPSPLSAYVRLYYSILLNIHSFFVMYNFPQKLKVKEICLNYYM